MSYDGRAVVQMNTMLMQVYNFFVQMSTKDRVPGQRCVDGANIPVW